MINSLHGATVLVTRPVAQAQNLCDLLARQGGKALRFPTLEICASSPEPQALQAATASDWLIFTSRNAVDFAIKVFNGKMPVLNTTQIAAVGEATASALQAAGWRVDCVPASEFSSEGLLAEPQLQMLAGSSCVIVRGVGGREKLAEVLTARGAKVAYLEVYKRLQPKVDSTELTDSLCTNQLHAVTVTSIEALQNLSVMVTEPLRTLLISLPLVVVSDRIRQVAEQMGFTHITVSKKPTDAAILETLTTLLNGENSGRNN
ncbi:uroporphyrinogen-III synthase [Methylomonas sp. AM2-LC]|uniref:uroporphyrinogen-III synthase n=1 Tax=Methylomonas sp. AM2-LC TaxID=3153301 RepID=UPI00326646C5